MTTSVYKQAKKSSSQDFKNLDEEDKEKEQNAETKELIAIHTLNSRPFTQGEQQEICLYTRKEASAYKKDTEHQKE